MLNRNKGRERWIWWREEDSVKQGEWKGALELVKIRGEC